eukprot:1148112-Pelagomonas_calceolata.AAC.2
MKGRKQMFGGKLEKIAVIDPPVSLVSSITPRNVTPQVRSAKLCGNATSQVTAKLCGKGHG